MLFHRIWIKKKYVSSLALCVLLICKMAMADTSVSSTKNPAVFIEMPILSHPSETAEMNAWFFQFLPRLEGNAMEVLSTQYPSLSKFALGRFTEWTLNLAWKIPFSVFQHELGHYMAARSIGYEGKITLTGLSSGYTEYSRPSDSNLWNPEDMLILSKAGLNQQQLNAMTLYSLWALDGSITYQEGLAYLMQPTSFLYYCLKSAHSRNQPSGASPRDDIYVYQQSLQAPVSIDSLVLLSTLPMLLSGGFWAAVLGQLDFLQSGHRRISMPTIKLGEARITAPNLHVFLGLQGPIIGGRMFVLFERKPALEVGIDVSYAQTKVVALFTKVHGLRLCPWLSISPFIRTSFSFTEPWGISVGSDVSIQVHNRLQWIFRASYDRNDLLMAPLLHQNGLNLLMSLAFSIGTS